MRRLDEETLYLLGHQQEPDAEALKRNFSFLRVGGYENTFTTFLNNRGYRSFYYTVAFDILWLTILLGSCYIGVLISICLLWAGFESSTFYLAHPSFLIGSFCVIFGNYRIALHALIMNEYFLQQLLKDRKNIRKEERGKITFEGLLFPLTANTFENQKKIERIYSQQSDQKPPSFSYPLSSSIQFWVEIFLATIFLIQLILLSIPVVPKDLEDPNSNGEIVLYEKILRTLEEIFLLHFRDNISLSYYLSLGLLFFSLSIGGLSLFGIGSVGHPVFLRVFMIFPSGLLYTRFHENEMENMKILGPLLKFPRRGFFFLLNKLLNFGDEVAHQQIEIYYTRTRYLPKTMRTTMIFIILCRIVYSVTLLPSYYSCLVFFFAQEMTKGTLLLLVFASSLFFTLFVFVNSFVQLLTSLHVALNGVYFMPILEGEAILPAPMVQYNPWSTLILMTGAFFLSFSRAISFFESSGNISLYLSWACMAFGIGACCWYSYSKWIKGFFLPTTFLPLNLFVIPFPFISFLFLFCTLLAVGLHLPLWISGVSATSIMILAYLICYCLYYFVERVTSGPDGLEVAKTLANQNPFFQFVDGNHLSLATSPLFQDGMEEEEMIIGFFADRIQDTWLIFNPPPLVHDFQLSNKPQFGLVEACASIHEGRPWLKHHLIFACLKGRKSTTKYYDGELSEEECGALWLYSSECSLAQQVNAAIRSQQELPFLPYIQLLSSALTKLPSCQGTFWATIDVKDGEAHLANLEYAMENEGKVWISGFVSCVMSQKLCMQLGPSSHIPNEKIEDPMPKELEMEMEVEIEAVKKPARILFKIESDRAKDISDISAISHSEFLLVNPCFKVEDAKYETSDLIIAHLIEFES